MSDKFDGQIVTEEAIIIWADSLFNARAFKNDKGDNPKKSHSATLLFKKDSEGAKQILATSKACADHHFPDEGWGGLSIQFLKDGDKEAEVQKRRGKNRDILKGYLVVSINTPEANPPEVVDIAGNPVLPNSIKGGEIVRGYLNIAPKKDNDGTPGVKAYMNAVLVVNRIGEENATYGKVERKGGRSAADAFSAYMGQKRETNPAEDSGVDLSNLV